MNTVWASAIKPEKKVSDVPASDIYAAGQRSNYAEVDKTVQPLGENVWELHAPYLSPLWFTAWKYERKAIVSDEDHIKV